MSAQTPVRNTWKVLVTAEETGGRVAIVEGCLRHGTAPPRHVHSREDVYVYVLCGRLSFVLGGERYECTAGSGLLLPRGDEHVFTVETSSACALLVITPAGLETCLGELEELERDSADGHHIERLIALAARFGVAITGPARSP